MGRYVDGFVIPVKKDRIDEYKEMASGAADIWMKHGALEYVECVGDDLDPDMDGWEFTRFGSLARAADDETVVFAFIVFESREHRDAVNAKVMGDPAMKDPANEDKPMPFEVGRMAYGGFGSVVDRVR